MGFGKLVNIRSEGGGEYNNTMNSGNNKVIVISQVMRKSSYSIFMPDI